MLIYQTAMVHKYWNIVTGNSRASSNLGGQRIHVCTVPVNFKPKMTLHDEGCCTSKSKNYQQRLAGLHFVACARRLMD